MFFFIEVIESLERQLFSIELFFYCEVKDEDFAKKRYSHDFFFFEEYKILIDNKSFTLSLY